MEVTSENPVNIKNEIGEFLNTLGYWKSRLIMGSGYTKEDYRWDKLTNLIVEYHKKGQPVADKIASEYVRLTQKRAEGRPNETPL